MKKLKIGTAKKSAFNTQMLRGSDFCPTSMATGFLYAFMPLAGLGILIVVAFKVTVALNAITKASKQALLPTDIYDLRAAGNSTAIQRSPSDLTLSKRYMAARAPPVTGFRSPPVTPSSEPSFVSGEEAFQLQLPAEVTQSQPQPLHQQQV